MPGEWCIVISIKIICYYGEVRISEDAVLKTMQWVRTKKVFQLYTSLINFTHQIEFIYGHLGSYIIKKKIELLTTWFFFSLLEISKKSLGSYAISKFMFQFISHQQQDWGLELGSLSVPSEEATQLHTAPQPQMALPVLLHLETLKPPEFLKCSFTIITATATCLP